MRNRDYYLYDDGHSRVTLSREGLRRAYGDNAALLKSARLHEIAAACACGGIVVVLVTWFVDALARGLS